MLPEASSSRTKFRRTIDDPITHPHHHHTITPPVHEHSRFDRTQEPYSVILAHSCSSEPSRCSICLDSIIDQTIIEPCQHSEFCFKCLRNWTDRSNRCPLCTRSIDRLIHRIDPLTLDFQRFTPLPILPNLYRDRIEESSINDHLNHPRIAERNRTDAIEPRTSHPNRPHTTSIRNPLPKPPTIDSDRPIGSNSRRDLVPLRSPHDSSDITTPRSIDSMNADRMALTKRRLIYSRSLYVKHIPSNPYTRFTPISHQHFRAQSKKPPTAHDPHHPAQLTTTRDSNLIDRTTRFLKRELRAIERSLIHPIDYTLRSILLILESLDSNGPGAVRLFGELMTDLELAQHFSHELTCFLRSPYEKLEDWDRVLQYPSLSISPLT